ncbi:Tn3 family transposase, partial [Klebsiella pneumoniae]
MGSCAAPSAKGDDKFITTDYLQQCPSDIIPDVLSTDTHGVNHVNFALLDLFGYQFAPRYAQVGKVI